MSARKISLQDLYPPDAGEERDSDKRAMGWSTALITTGVENVGAKNIASGPIPPRRRRGTGLRQKGDGVVDGADHHGSRKCRREKYRFSTYPPPTPARNGTPTKGRWGGRRR